MPGVLDLDAIKPEALTIRLGGADLVLAEKSLANMKAFQVKAKASDAAADMGGVADGMIEALAVIVPKAPRDAIAALTQEQALALIDFWAGATKEQIAKDSADFARAAADPT